MYCLGLGLQPHGFCLKELPSLSSLRLADVVGSLLHGSTCCKSIHFCSDPGLCLASLASTMDWTNDKLAGL